MPLAARRREAQPGQPHLGHRPQHRAQVPRRRVLGLLQVPDDLAQAGPVPAGDRADGLDHRALAFLAHPRQQQPQRLGGHGPLLGQVVAERERVEQPGRGRAQRQHPGLAAARVQQPDQRLGVALGVDHRDRHPAQRQLQISSRASVVLPPPGSPVIATAVGRLRARREQRVEMHDRPGPAQRLADVRADPARLVGDPVAQVHGGGRHPARDRVQRLALQVGAQPHPVAGQRLAQQRELVAGGVDHVDARCRGSAR